MDMVCSKCSALHWKGEKLKKTGSTNAQPLFGGCCLSGKIDLPKFPAPPHELLKLYTDKDDELAKAFRTNIRQYNDALAFTSVGRKLDHSLNQAGGGPYVFKINGKVHHNIGSLLPAEDRHPVYAQVYIFDPADALRERMGHEANQGDEHGGSDGEGGGPTGKRTCVSQTEYYRYHLFPRVGSSDHLFRAGKLFHEFVVDSWAISEQARLRWVEANQTTLRADSYRGLMDSIAADPTVTGEDIGQRVILPSSFSGSTRNMIQNCQDALAINRHFKGADLFITATANPHWPEIKSELLPGQDYSDRPDLIVRVFHQKMKELIKDIEKKQIFGKCVARVHTIEFQKRGLPHMHMIVFLDQDSKLRTPDDIDSAISAELPDPNTERELYDLVVKHMIHTPCGADGDQNSPCLRNGRCSKCFPKGFREQTSVSEDSYAQLRRRNNGRKATVTRKGRQFEVDNRYVVAYSRYLLWKYQCHINVECIASIKAIKYIYKYVYKGHDRTIAEIARNNNEVQQYLDARYVSACEALWRLLHFRMHEEIPNIVRLQVHLPNLQWHTFNPARQRDLQQVLQDASNRDTTLTAWFKSNSDSQDGQNLLYQDYPAMYTWDTKKRKWNRRVLERKMKAIGRMYYVHAASGERFYLRLLLTVVTGATSFEDLRTVEGTVYPSFREACIRRGLLDDDNEWRQCLQEAAHMASGHQLRTLFATILKCCTPADPLALWLEFREHICDDLRRTLEREHNIQNPDPDHVYDFGLYLLNKVLIQMQFSLDKVDGMAQPVGDWAAVVGNPLIREQRAYNQEEQGQLAAERIPTLNVEQRAAFDQITHAVEQQSGQTFFLHGPGGTGKTYVYNTLCYHLRGQGKIVLCVASSGIASLLLMGGRTSHSTFHIPLSIHESSTCSISKQSDLAELIRETSLVIWDEAPMQHRHIHEAVDRTFKDIRNCPDKPFGGLSVVFGGDFQQILPNALFFLPGMMMLTVLTPEFSTKFLEKPESTTALIQHKVEMKETKA
ncbi:hypothetical protein H1R20_g2134, partial [Candolleomyces eurysporus]